jgi:hypothetical protein
VIKNGRHHTGHEYTRQCNFLSCENGLSLLSHLYERGSI